MIYYLFHNSNKNIKICHNKIINPDAKEIDTILYEFHTCPASGHSGFHKTYNRIKNYYYWKNMKRDIFKYVKECKSSQLNKISRKNNTQPIEITNTSDKPFEKIALDIVGPLPLTESGNKYSYVTR